VTSLVSEVAPIASRQGDSAFGMTVVRRERTIHPDGFRCGPLWSDEPQKPSGTPFPPQTLIGLL
jgi:hypothetical protein